MYKPVEMILWVDREGKNNPIRFKVYNEDDGESYTYNILHCCEIEENKQVGLRKKVYNVLIQAQDGQRRCRIIYEIDSCKWYVDPTQI